MTLLSKHKKALPRALALAALAAATPPWAAHGAEAPPTASNDAEAPIPMEIHERLWDEPGPQQGEEGAPRLLLVNPAANAEPFEDGPALYAGRVEPAAASVTLNGEALHVYPGGTFTGLKALPAPGKSETWTFTARAGGKTTVIKRRVRAWAPAPPAPARPLSYWAAPVRPTGTYLLAGGTRLDITLYASPGARAEFRRVGETQWQPMTGEADPAHGGKYTGTYKVPAQANKPEQESDPNFTPVARIIEFRIRKGDEVKSLASRLLVGRLPAGRVTLAKTLVNRVTFLKNPAGWERWGNWAEGTLFPVLEQRGERFKTCYGPEGEGYVDNENYEKAALVTGGQPAADLTAEKITAETAADGQTILRIPSIKRPVAFRALPLPQAGDRVLNLELYGVKAPQTLEGQGGEGTAAAHWELRNGAGPEPARLRVELVAPLWGYDVTAPTTAGLEIMLRAKPRPRGCAGKPLTGLKIMLDPGHGGKDDGAVGPSGLCEKDANLVEAGYVERALKKLGATVKVTRRDDTFISLDGRVQMALDWRPDLFVTLHHNSIAAGSPLLQSGPKLFSHYALGQPAARAIAAKLGPLWSAEPGVQTHVARVIRNQTACPAVLVETAYLSNPLDEARLRKTATLKADGEAIAQGIAALWEP